MTFASLSSSIFLLESELNSTPVQRTFLQIYKEKTKIIKRKDTQALAKIRSQDLLIVDVSISTLETLRVLGTLLRQTERPKLLITTVENQIFQRNDCLIGGLNHILYKPFSLTDLTSSIETLCSAQTLTPKISVH